jgi:hypothetical protein
MEEVERNDGMCPECDTFVNYTEVDENEEEEEDIDDLYDEDDDDNDSSFGEPYRGRETRDVFDEFLDEEEQIEKQQKIQQRNKRIVDTELGAEPKPNLKEICMKKPKKPKTAKKKSK